MRTEEPGIGESDASKETGNDAPVEIPLTPAMARAVAPTGLKSIGWRVLQWASLVVLALVVVWGIYAIPHGGVGSALVILLFFIWFPAFGVWWGRRALRRMAADLASGVFLRAEGAIHASEEQRNQLVGDSFTYVATLRVGKVRLEHQNTRLAAASKRLTVGSVDYTKVTKTILELRDEQGTVVYQDARLSRYQKANEADASDGGNVRDASGHGNNG